MEKISLEGFDSIISYITCYVSDFNMACPHFRRTFISLNSFFGWNILSMEEEKVSDNVYIFLNLDIAACRLK